MNCLLCFWCFALVLFIRKSHRLNGSFPNCKAASGGNPKKKKKTKNLVEMMIGELPPESSSRGRKRKSPPSPSQSPIPIPTVLSLPAVGGVKDVNICVRLESQSLERDKVGCKWLRLKIPSILLQKREQSSPSSAPSSINSVHSSSEDFSPSPEFNQERSRQSPDIENISGVIEEEHNRQSPEIEKENISSGSDDSSEEKENIRVPTWDEIFSNYPEQKLRPFFYAYILCKLDPINGPFVFEPLVQTKSAYMSESSCASIGSVIYALGNDDTHVPEATQLFLEAWGIANPLKPPPQLPSSSSSSTAILNASHRLHFCNFSKRDPIWEISPAPLLSPRLYPKLVSLDGKLYAFGGNRLLDDDAPFAEVYDPQLGIWEPLPNPPFPRLPYRQLFLFPLPESHEILVIGCLPSRTSYTFNTVLSSWHRYNCLHLCQLLYTPRSIPYQPVILGHTLYWIDIIGQLCVFNVESGRFYRGHITPFHNDHEDLTRFLKTFELCCSYALVPISSSLLAILWSDTHYIARGFCCGSTLHITLVNISLHQPIKILTDSDFDSSTDSESEHERRLSLTASVVACLCFPLVSEEVRVVDAYIIDDDTGSWQSMSLCSSYHDIADKA